MKKNCSRLFFYSITLLFLFLVSCEEEKKKMTETDLIFSSIKKDQAKWYRYHKSNIHLASEFLPLDQAGDTIAKKEFLEALLTGDFIAMEIKSNTSEDTYRLFKLDEESDENIGVTITADTYPEYRHFMMEGKEFPDFEFTDLEGKTYSKDKLKGKTVVVKTWFIACKPCIEEMPQLNQLVEKYQDREDVVFLSLSTDPQQDLEKFLTTMDFHYRIVPDTGKFIKEKLGLSVFPTHIIVDENGIMRKVVNTAPEMISFLESTSIPDLQEDEVPPPPPM